MKDALDKLANVFRRERVANRMAGTQTKDAELAGTSALHSNRNESFHKVCTKHTGGEGLKDDILTCTGQGPHRVEAIGCAAPYVK